MMDENTNPSLTIWKKYYQANEGRGLRPLLTEWLGLIQPNVVGQAIDLGCGEGIETLALLQAGWRVLAFDREPEGIARLKVRTPPELVDRLEARELPFEMINLLPRADLIHAAYSIPFCTPEYFPTLWRLITESLNTGGRFVGQLFGVNDAWSANRAMTFHTADGVATLFDGFTFESYQEFEGERPTALGDLKHWHVFHLIARKQGITA